ncbi:hypothetical protein B0H14DRAFT_2594340 [Mycena olivaceomarginata]|nr:hypothetical protein B0H14DRAFT_2594340 [Mycena olivaceomarginata]
MSYVHIWTWTGCLSGSSLVLPPPALPVDNSPPPVDDSPPPEPETQKDSEPTDLLNLYLAVYALDVGGSTAEFSERWKALEQEKPPLALFQVYDKYSKELV